MTKKSLYRSILLQKLEQIEDFHRISDILGLCQHCRWTFTQEWIEDENRTENELKQIMDAMNYKTQG